MKFQSSRSWILTNLWLVSSSVMTVQAFISPTTTSTSSMILQSSEEDTPSSTVQLSRRGVLEQSMTFAAVTGVGTTMGLFTTPLAAMARLESVNRPDLLPTEPNQYVIQTEKYLTGGQARRMNDLLTALERDTGFRMRVLCQAYPNTPGLAIRDYWDLGKDGQKDDKYIVLVVDQFGGKSNILNFNVGDGVKFALPNVFWTRLAAKYGTTFYVRDNGMDIAITNAVDSIVACLRSEDGFCTAPQDEAPSMKRMGLL